MDPTILLGAGILAFVAILSGLLGLRHRIAFRLASRNVRKARGRTVLLILGLLVATTIVSGSLIIGDTVNAVNVHFVYQSWGFVDEAIYNQTPAGDYAPFPYSVYSSLSRDLATHPDVAGVTPLILSAVSVYDRTSGIPQTDLHLIGVDGNTSRALGSFTDDHGSSLPGPLAGSVLLDDQAASDLNASAGHSVVLFARSTVPLTVQAVVHDDSRGGFLFGGNAFVTLATARSLLNLSGGSINFLAVSNAGSLSGAVDRTDSVSSQLNRSLANAGTAANGLGVHPVLRDDLVRAQASSQSLATLFLVLGLFSIVAGAMLIVGIFVMLSEERKGEMGTLRAIGLKRAELVYAFYFEGLFYSAGSALAGSFLGVAVAYVMTYAFSIYFASGSVTGQAILQSFTVLPQSLLIGYVAGFLLTLVTIAVASARVSRLNIVRAIRSIPEPPPAIRLYTGLAYVGVALAVLGGLLFFATRTGTGDLSYPLLGGTMLILGLCFLASRFVKNRIAFSAAGAGLLVWGGAEPLHRYLLGSSHSGTIFVIFIEGILLVVGAVLLYIFNAVTVVNATARLVTRRPSAISVVRIGLSYPSRRPFRTAVNLTIFALVLFTIVSVASFGSSLETNLDQTIAAQSGGYTFFGFSQTPIPNFPGLVANNSTLRPLFTHIVPLDQGGAQFAWTGLGNSWSDGVFSAPTNVPTSSSFYATNAFNFTSTVGGLSAAAVWHRVATDPTAAVVDNSYTLGGINFGPTTNHPGLAVGTNVTLTNATGTRAHVTVLGILAESFLTGIFINPSTATGLGVTTPNAYLLSTGPGISSVRAAQLAKSAFFPYGLVLFDFAQILKTSIQGTEAVIGLLVAFVGLGLAVGIAAVGIVALRAVVERRSEIGMLRAIGFRQRGILAVFLLEYSYVALLGIGIGTALGVLLIWDAAQGAGSVLAFSIPWLTIGLIILISYLLTVAAVFGPAFRASRLPPAEAVRYSE